MPCCPGCRSCSADGRSARTVHFAVMALLVVFFVVHMAMILLAGPLNELRSIITGRYRLSPRREKDADV